jgi:hypothetical protein
MRRRMCERVYKQDLERIPTTCFFPPLDRSSSRLHKHNLRPHQPQTQRHQSFIMVLGFGNKTAAQNPTSPTHPTSTSATHPTSTSTTHPGTHTGTTGGTHAVGNGPISGTGYNNYPEVHTHGKTGEGVSGHHVSGSGAHVAGTHLPGKSESSSSFLPCSRRCGSLLLSLFQRGRIVKG